MSKNDLLKLRNFGYKSCEELISAIINFHKKSDDIYEINDEFKIKANFKQTLEFHERKYSTKINFKHGINNDGILCIANEKDYSDEFWNFIQEKFQNIKTQFKLYHGMIQII